MTTPTAALLLCSTVWSTAALAQAPPPPPAAPPPAPAKEIQASESRLQFYGFLRTDILYDDSRPDNSQAPLFILSERAGARDQANFTLHPRLSRLGLNFAGPVVEPLAGAKLGGKLEFDWQNGGRESRAIPRFRHVYATMSWSATTVLLGTTSDLISPLFPAANGDTLMWNAGNLGDRRPQVRLTVQPRADALQWTAAVAAGLTGAVDQQDLDNDTIRDGEAAAVPNLQARLGVSYPAGKRRFSAGIWGHLARMKVATAIAGQTEFDSHSFGLDVELPIASRGILRGEAWTGRNLSDFRGGIAQAVNRTTGEEISSKGGWAEVGVDVTRRYSLFVGYTIEKPDAEDLAGGARARNGAWFVANRWTVRPIVIGADYLRWKTEYIEAPDGTDNRANVYVIYSF